MDTYTVKYRAHWTLLDYIEIVPGRKLIEGFIALCTDGPRHGTVLRLYRPETTISRERAASTWLMVEGALGEMSAVIIDADIECQICENTETGERHG